MALFNLAKKPQAPAQPARDAWEVHKRRGVELQRDLAAKQASQSALTAAIARQSAIVSRLAEIATEETNTGIASSEKGKLQAQYNATSEEIKRLLGSDTAESLKAQIAELDARKTAHDALNEGFVRDVALEEVLEMAPEFLQLEEKFRAFHKRVFTRLGVLQHSTYGYNTFGSLHISRPLDPSDTNKVHPLYARGPRDHWQAKLAKDAEERAMDAEVAAYKDELKKVD
jgi:hypothetical protein